MTHSLKLNEESLIVKDNQQQELIKGEDFELTNQGLEGFTLTLLRPFSGKLNISYETFYQYNLGEDAPFKNEVSLELYDRNPLKDEASVWPDEAIKQNGSKDGYYDYSTQLFNWEVIVNRNRQSLNQPIFNDQFPDRHELFGEISIEKVTYNQWGGIEQTTPIELDSKNVDSSGFSLELPQGRESYRIRYQTQDTTNIYPQTEHGFSVINHATLEDEGMILGSWSKEINLRYTNQLIDKKINLSQSKLQWKLEVNYQNATLEEVKSIILCKIQYNVL